MLESATGLIRDNVQTFTDRLREMKNNSLNELFQRYLLKSVTSNRFVDEKTLVFL